MGNWISIGKVLEISAGDNKVSVKCERGYVDIVFLSDGIMRVAAKRKEEEEDYSYVVDESKYRFTGIEYDRQANRIKAGHYVVKIAENEFGLEVYYDDVLLFTDAQPAIMFKEKGDFKFAKKMQNEHFYGLGEKAFPLDKRGLFLRMNNHDTESYAPYEDPLYVDIPFFMVLRPGYHWFGIFLDNPADSFFDFSAKDNYSFGACYGPARYYIIGGPTPAKVLERYTELTGRIERPPLWAIGFHQSRWGYKTPKDFIEIGLGYRVRGIPLDVLHMDIDYMEGYRVFTWNRKRFPDPAKVIAELNKMGIHVVTIIDPGVKIDPGYTVYRELFASGKYLREKNNKPFVGWVWPGPTIFPDFTIPSIREWWGDKHKVLFDAGVEGIWNDMNEIAYNIQPLVPRSAKNVVFHDNGRLTPYKALHNAYANYEAMGTICGFRKHLPNKRYFVLSRSGYAGIQRYAAIWTGDNWSTWEHLRLSIWMITNFGISGVPFIGADIGGFSRIFYRPFFVTIRYAELFVRWIQLGVFYPFSRIHSSSLYPLPGKAIRQEPWVFGKKVEQIAREYIALRYKLLPLIYDAFVEASLTGRPVAAPLLFDYPRDKRSIECNDEFLFAKFLLIAPVFKRGARVRKVYLPPGKWVDYWTHKIYTGGNTVTVDAPLEKMPIFIKGGSVLVYGPLRMYVKQKPLAPLELHVFALESTEHVHYEDDGETFDYKKGIESRMKITVRREKKGATVVIGQREGKYLPPERKLIIKLYTEFRPRLVKVNGENNDFTIRETGELYEIAMEFPDTGEKRKIEIIM